MLEPSFYYFIYPIFSLFHSVFFLSPLSRSGSKTAAPSGRNAESVRMAATLALCTARRRRIPPRPPSPPRPPPPPPPQLAMGRPAPPPRRPSAPPPMSGISWPPIPAIILRIGARGHTTAWVSVRPTSISGFLRNKRTKGNCWAQPAPERVAGPSQLMRSMTV